MTTRVALHMWARVGEGELRELLLLWLLLLWGHLLVCGKCTAALHGGDALHAGGSLGDGTGSSLLESLFQVSVAAGSRDLRPSSLYVRSRGSFPSSLVDATN